MSVETNSVPPWKLALLEKKRRQEDDRRKHDNDDPRLSQMPAWKREILLKKQHQKNSTVYLTKHTSPDKHIDEGDGGRPRSSGRNSSAANENEVPNISVDGAEEEVVHIVPITKNPLLKNDPKFKAGKQSRHSWLGASGSNNSSSHSNPASHSSSWAGDTDGPANRNSAIDDDVFAAAEEEVAYGRGFVHKLLQRFSHLSTKEEEAGLSTALAGRRSSSTENILEGRLSPGYHANGKAATPNRARSTDNLLSPSSIALSPQNSYSGDTASSLNDTNSSHLSEDEADLHNASIASNDSVVEELPKPNTVRTARSVFESIASTKPATSSSDSALAKPKLAVKPQVVQQPEHGKYYNDTLSRKAGVHAARHDEPADCIDHGPLTPTSPTRKADSFFASSSANSVVKPQSPPAAKPASHSWNYSGSKDKTEASGPKRSFLYPSTKPTQAPAKVTKEPVLTNGTAAKPHSLNGDHAKPPQSDNERVLHIENNVHESTTDSPVRNNKQHANNRNETSKKPDHNRLNLNLQLDTNGTSPRTESNDNNDAIQSLNLRNKLKKRPAPAGPGSMLIRPASNLVTGTKTEYLKLTSYNDVKKGEFAPAKRRAPVDSDDEDVPVTNIDDVLDDIPVTDIDNVGRADKNDNLVKKTKFEFVGSNVSLSKNLLVKTRHGKRNKLQFEQQTTMFEYPSEQHLMDTMTPEPGDLDFNRGINRHRSTDSVSSDDGSDIMAPGPPPPATTLASNSLGVGQSSGSLGTYRSKVGMEYELGVKVEDEVDTAPSRPSQAPQSPPHDVSITPGDEDTTWSDVQSSDLLF